MSNRRRWSWSSALIGATSATAAATVIWARPRDPIIQLISITLSSFHINLPLLDVDLNLTVHVTNPNVVPVHYSAATVPIFYAGSRLGTAQVYAGSQPRKSCQLLQLPARLHALELAHHAPALLADVARRKVALDASVDISGTAQVLGWEHRFSVHVDSNVIVDPIFMKVIDQENRSKTHIYLAYL